MATTDLGSCEWFVWDLRRSNLIDRGQLDQVIGEFLKKQPRAEPPALAEYLVKEKVLTQFQAERILQGKTQGLVLGPYLLMDALGSGSMGTVYKAQNKTDNQWYAVKVLPRRSMWNVRVARRHVRSFEQCKHPAVVPFVDVGTSGGTHYLAWPLVEGITLESIIQEHGKLDAGLSALVGLQTAEGLDICHRNGLIHGLLKPSNLMVGEDNQVRILDFGIGNLLAESEGESLVDTMSTANSLTSGLDCCSPESIMEPTNRTPAGDQYSLGCVLYYCLTGRYPFAEGTAVDKMMAHQTKQPTPLRELSPEVPEGLVVVVDRLMQKAPEARYAQAADAAEALRPLVEAFAGMSQSFIADNASLLSSRSGPPPALVDNGRKEPAASKVVEREEPAPARLEPSARREPPAPSRPEPVAPARREPVAPTRTEPVAPVRPEPVAPARREPAAPTRTEPVAPARREPTLPTRQDLQAPRHEVPLPPRHEVPSVPREEPPPRTPSPRGLPTRDSFRRSGPNPPAAPAQPQEAGSSAGDEPASPRRSLEDRLGAGGVIILAVVASALTFLVMYYFFPKR